MKNEEVTTSSAQDNNKDLKKKRVALYFNSQYDEILKTEEVTKTIIMDKINLATYDLCNDTAERSDKVHKDNILVTVINRSNLMNRLNETITTLANELRLEETAIKSLVQLELNKKAKS